MYQDIIIGIAKEAVYVALMVAMPILGASLLTGLLFSIFQATTQIQEQTLAFIPKIVAVFVIVVVFGPWMLNIMIDFTTSLYISIPNLVSK